MAFFYACDGAAILFAANPGDAWPSLYVSLIARAMGLEAQGKLNDERKSKCNDKARNEAWQRPEQLCFAQDDPCHTNTSHGSTPANQEALTKKQPRDDKFCD